MDYVIKPHKITSIEIVDQQSIFPVHRIYCVGRNYAAHAREMGGDPQREAPFFFMKPADAIVLDGDDIPYPSKTSNLQHEIELVVAIGKEGKNISKQDAESHIYGYAIGNDLTRRDLQFAARDKGRPWDTGKAFDCSAPISKIHPKERVKCVNQGVISLKVNGEIRQQGNLSDMILDVSEIISELSGFFLLQPGDLIFTGTPSGVGPVVAGDLMEGYIEGLGTLINKIVG